MNETKQLIISQILGDLTITSLIVCYIFSFIGMSWHIIADTIYGIEYSRKTPSKFDLWYWIKNNIVMKILSFILAIMTIFIILRLGPEIGLTVSGVSQFGMALYIGYNMDVYVKQLKSKLENGKE